MPTKKTAEKKTANTRKTTKTTAKKGKNCCCNQTEAAQDNCRLTDYDIVSDVLGGHKNLIKLYGTSLCETDCEQLRKIINSQMTECATDQLDAFKYMNDRGMYKVEAAPVQKVKSARTKFSDSLKNFDKGEKSKK